ncbi:M23 family metallopeptidase [Photobacterium sp. 1_MG-2023]|uniref:M23 family metallopeptidase n=1 Tax=Photobacterium sp. 1_MG-2023 TaxID=3062646 RepID=UPI0026E160A6|nr:M23 family metallopeptidase [Photobacterium sp. 1_MG-2023]MDO6709010.1 M23 family metallopeptidase [Photobacterium sp. 1_MG-2023]
MPDIPLKIEAGEHLGYLGKYEFLKNAQGNIDQEYRVHLEVFSNDRPPEYFLKALAAGQEEHGFQVIDGSGSNGVMEPENVFFNDIYRAIDTDTDGQLSENELIAFYQSATNKLEKVIAKHPSEWHFEEQVDNAWFNQVLEKGRDLLEQHASKYFQSEAIFQESAYREKIMSLYDDFIDHEKARIEQTAWMQQLDTEKLEIQPQVWHFWPLSISNIYDGERHWHEPILNPMSTNYSQYGNKKEYWGLFGENIRKGNKSSAHRALDIFAEVGTDVYACVDAEIQHTRHSDTNGNLIVLKVSDEKLVQRIWDERLNYKVHSLKDRTEDTIGSAFDLKKGLKFAYMHLKSIEANPETGKPLQAGDKVKMGQIIAKSGVSGTGVVGTRAPHLHFEVSTKHMYGDSSTKINPGYFVNFKYKDQQNNEEIKLQSDTSQKFHVGHHGDGAFSWTGFAG